MGAPIKNVIKDEVETSTKKKVSKDGELGEEYIIRSLKSIENRRTQRQDEDEDQLFGRQIATTLHRLTSRQKATAKLRIQQILIDVEFLDETQPAKNHYNLGFR